MTALLDLVFYPPILPTPIFHTGPCEEDGMGAHISSALHTMGQAHQTIHRSFYSMVRITLRYEYADRHILSGEKTNIDENTYETTPKDVASLLDATHYLNEG